MEQLSGCGAPIQELRPAARRTSSSCRLSWVRRARRMPRPLSSSPSSAGSIQGCGVGCSITAIDAMDVERTMVIEPAARPRMTSMGAVGGLLGRNTRGGTIVAGALNLGGSIEMIHNAVRIAELAIDKQAQTLLMPVSARRQLNDLPDDLWTKISIEFYKDGADAVFKALDE